MRNLVEKPAEDDKRFKHVALRVLNARVSLSSWMLALSSAGIAYIAAGLMLFGPGLKEFGQQLPFEGYLWTPLLVLGTTAVILGFIFVKRLFLMRYGSFLSFLMWIFGSIAFAQSGQIITAIIVGLPWVLFYGYVYLASFFRDETGI